MLVTRAPLAVNRHRFLFARNADIELNDLASLVFSSAR